mgnify:CR=1 FL=1
MVCILVPTDGSTQAESALRKAFEMFPDARIAVLHVTQVTSLRKGDTESAAELASRESKEILASAEEIAGDHGREIDTVAREGHAAKTIVSYAEENEVDHIVIGSIGRSGVRRVLLGSVAETVVRRAPCAVTIVREEGS